MLSLLLWKRLLATGLLLVATDVGNFLELVQAHLDMFRRAA